MQVALILVALAGCNEIYGLDRTKLQEVPPDVPYSCPDNAAPEFRGMPVAVDVGSGFVRSYSFALERSIAVGTKLTKIFEGERDQPVSKESVLVPPMPTTVVRIAPEGDEIFVRNSLLSNMWSIEKYRRVDEHWEHVARVLVFSSSGDPAFSNPSPRSVPPRRMIVQTGTAELQEYEETAPDKWTPIGQPYLGADLGATTTRDANITPDRLRLIFQGSTGTGTTVLYATRPNVDARFGMAFPFNPFFGSPPLFDPALVDDCSRFYFLVAGSGAGQNGIYYVAPN